jgi:hypothetical protein
MRGVRSGADRNGEAMLGGKPGRAYLYGGWHPGGAGKTRWEADKSCRIFSAYFDLREAAGKQTNELNEWIRCHAKPPAFSRL